MAAVESKGYRTPCLSVSLHVFVGACVVVTCFRQCGHTCLHVCVLCLQSWGGKENGFGLAECCKNLPATVSWSGKKKD